MNMRGNLLMAAWLVALGVSAPGWAGNTCTLLDIAGVTGDGGSSAILSDPDSTACGIENHANEADTFAFGGRNTVSGAYGNAFGFSNHVGGEYDNVFGLFSHANADYSNAFGSYNHADGNYSNAFGTDSSTGSGADYSIAFGAGDFANPLHGGASVGANVTSAIAIGHTVNANANDSVAMGHGAVVNASAVGAVALGSDSIANEADTLSVGHTATDIDPSTYFAYGSALDRRIVNVAAGTADTDAVNVGQMQSYVDSRAGSASPWFVGTGDPGVTDDSDRPVADGKHVLAAGAGSKATGETSSAVGYGNTAARASLGPGCISCTAFGDSAFGTSNRATGTEFSSAFGSMNVADFAYSNAFGSSNTASGYESSAFGVFNTASIDYSSAFGYQNTASAHGGSAFGNANTASGFFRSSAFGYANTASAANSSAFGNQNTAEGDSSAAFGYGNSAAADDSVAMGHNNTANGYSSSALGVDSKVGGKADYSIVLGTGDEDNQANDGANVADNVTSAIAIGHTVNVNAGDGIAMGHNATVAAGAAGSVAIGANSVAAAANTFSVGNSTAQRRIVNVADGNLSDTSTDAVNGSQLYATNQDVAANAKAIGTLNSMAVFYADAAHTQIVFGAAGTPVVLSNVAAGTAPTDAVNKAQLDAVATQVGQVVGAAVAYDAADKADVTLAGANGTVIHNVAAGTAGTDAVNKSQLDSVDARVTTVNQQVTDNTTAIHDIDNRVTTVEGQVNQLQQSTASLGYLAADGKGDGSDDASVKAGSRGVAIGSGASVGGDHGTAIGGDSYAVGPNDTALGGHARVNADGSTAVGANTAIATAATNAVAVGESVSVSAASGTAIGQGARVTASHAVALGQGSMADQPDTVSVGSTGHTRRVTNVAAGTGATDAVNKGQLDAVTAQALETAKKYAQTGDKQTLRRANAYTDQQIRAALGGDMAAFRQNVNDRFYQVDRRMDRLSAMQSASTQMAINAAGAQGNGRLAVGMGFSSGKSALSVGYGAPLSKHLHVSFGATASGSETSAGIGFGVDL